MLCEFCGKEIKADDKYCDFCGAKVEDVETKESTPAPKKKKHKAIKIIVIILIVFTLISCIFWVGMALIFTSKFSAIDFESSYDDLYDEFSDYFDKYFDSNGDYYYNFGDDDFAKGEVVESQNGYKSTYGNLDFSLPASWEVSNLTDEFYAENTLTGAILSVNFYDADDFTSVKDIKSFNKWVKSEINDYKTYGYDIIFADDSTITINSTKYSQLAAKITDSSDVFYEYEFTRAVDDDCFMRISILSSDLNEVGDIIDYLNND